MISFRLYREHGALNSRPIFDALENSIRRSGHSVVSKDEDVSVIWSVLWRGRMKANDAIYQTSVAQKKPVMILEVGNLLRGQTWRVSLYNINRQGYFANQDHLDPSRAKKLNVELMPPRTSRKSSILLATQHDQSLQWQGQPKLLDWIKKTVSDIRRYTDREIVIRPHPRCPVNIFPDQTNVRIDRARRIDNTYDDYDINFDYHCVINHNSGPTVQSAIAGTPVICDRSGLAYDVSGRLEHIESIHLPDREDWFVKLCHTEWTVDEISAGIPLERLLPKISLDLEKN